MRNTNKKKFFYFILMIGSILLCLNPSMESVKIKKNIVVKVVKVKMVIFIFGCVIWLTI